MEYLTWLTWQAVDLPPETRRVYVGSETTENSLADLSIRHLLFARLADAGIVPTLVTPPLTEHGLERELAFIEIIADRLAPAEVVCNDWGLLHRLSRDSRCVPIAGRLLARQAVDPRLGVLSDAERHKAGRVVRHADGTAAEVRWRPPTGAMAEHLCRVSLDTPDALGLLECLGVRRIELSNVLQGLILTLRPGWSVTLHVPFVLVALARHEWDADGQGASDVSWHHPSFPVPLIRRGNTIYYSNESLPPDPSRLHIDRIVRSL